MHSCDSLPVSTIASTELSWWKDVLGSDGAQIIAVVKEQLASFQNFIGCAVTTMHSFQLVAEIAQVITDV